MFTARKETPSFFELAGLFVLLASAILYAVKPWPHYFFDGLPAKHWDPQLMDTWMAWNAHNILKGRFLVPDYNINFFYPHSHVLAFSELLWPQSFVYALAHSLTGNHFFCFNACMLFFWTLSGVLLYVLLRSLEMSRTVSALGGFIYCLMPFRMPYYLEFNMQLVFIFPLMILVAVRWLNDPSWKNSLWFCLCFFLSATSCLYYTLMVIIMMTFIAIAFLASRGELFRRREFYFASAVLLTGCLLITVIYLYPYALLRIKGGYQRSMSDYMQYFAQPMHYLDARWSYFLKWLPLPWTSYTETRLFPGTALGLLTLIFLLHDSIKFCKHYAAVPKVGRWIAAAKCAFWLFFWTVILLNAFLVEKADWLKPLDPFLYYVSCALIVLYIAGLLFIPGKERTSAKLLAALSAAAVFCFFISCGPFISTGPNYKLLRLAKGIFLDLISWNPLFGAVRVLTRFSIVILTYLTVAGCHAFNRLALRQQKILWSVPLLLFILIHEARHMEPPWKSEKHSYEFTRSFPDSATSSVLRKAYALPGKNVFFYLPIGMRTIDANVVMSTIGNFSLVIDGLSGFIPDFYGRLYHLEEKEWHVDKMLAWAEEVWPTPYLILDRSSIFSLERGWHRQFPWEEAEKYGELIEKDDVYSLYRPKKMVSQEERILRHVRTDMLQAHRRLTFQAKTTDDGPGFASVSLNQQLVKEQIPLTVSWQSYTIPLPVEKMGNVKGEEVEIKLTGGRSWLVKNVNFLTAQ